VLVEMMMKLSSAVPVELSALMLSNWNAPPRLYAGDTPAIGYSRDYLTSSLRNLLQINAEFVSTRVRNRRCRVTNLGGICRVLGR
jgi:hypothetical protein